MELQLIQNKIYKIRGQKVMLDFDLASLYEVQTKVLNQAVKRNIQRFPVDFMFRLTIDEWESMRSQIATASNNDKNMRSQKDSSNSLRLQNETLDKGEVNTQNIYLMLLPNKDLQC